jgi:hypothetical protein
MKDALNYTFCFILSLIVVGTFVGGVRMIREWWGDDAETGEWCLMDILPLAGGSFNGDQNTSEFQIITTEGGHKVYQKCAKN